MDDAYQKLEAELDRTAVISLEFKRLILAWAVQLASEAYNRGYGDGYTKGHDEGSAR